MIAIESKQQVDLFEIGTEMRRAGLSDSFVANAIRTAMKFEGVRELVHMWHEESSKEERSEIVADIQDMVDDCAQTFSEEAAYIRFDDLETIAKNIRSFKNELLMSVNEQGGITKLATLTGIPQPSLSRFFNSDSMPRRATLLKIAKALDLDAVKIAIPWTR